MAFAHSLMTIRVVMAGGGTAGHAEPALATADALKRLQPQWQIEFLGTSSGIESHLVPARGYPLREIPKVPLPRRPSLGLLALPIRLIRAVRMTVKVLSGAEAFVGFGGYVSMPGYLAARLGKVPIVVHEQNARAGVANRIGAKWAAVRASAFSDSLRDAEVIGLPLRALIAELATDMEHSAIRTKAQARAVLGLDDSRPVLLVTGGSQGSARINAAVAQGLAALLAAGWQVVHGVGRLNSLPEAQPGYHPMPYIERMDLALAAADLLVGRAGAGTCAEAAALRVPAILVPLPIGNGEQALNARDMQAVGGAVVIEDAAFTGERLLSTVAQARPRLEQMSASLAGIAKLDAADVLAARIESLIIGRAH